MKNPIIDPKTVKETGSHLEKLHAIRLHLEATNNYVATDDPSLNPDNMPGYITITNNDQIVMVDDLIKSFQHHSKLPKKIGVNVIYSKQDKCYVAYTAKPPFVSAHGPTRAAAIVALEECAEAFMPLLQ